MPIKFNASVVRTTEEDWGTLIIFSVDETLEAERYLMIQRAREFSNEDVQLGMNDVYIETCGQGWSWYGHIVAVELLKGMIKIQLDAEAAARLDDNGLNEVSFDVPEHEFKHLRAALGPRVCGKIVLFRSCSLTRLATDSPALVRLCLNIIQINSVPRA